MAQTDPPHEPLPGPVFLQALRHAGSRVPLWLMIWGMFLLLALLASLPWFNGYTDAIENRYEPGSMVANLSETFRVDHRELFTHLSNSSQASGAVLAFFAMLAGIFVAGGWLQVFLERTGGRSLRRFFIGGSRYFFRFFRLLLITLLLLHFIGWLCYEMPWQVFVEKLLFGIEDGNYEVLESELDAIRIGWGQATLYAVLFGLIMTWGDYTRTRLALQDTHSAIWAGLCTLFVMIRHPVQTLVPMAGLLVFEILMLLSAWSIQMLFDQGLGAESNRLDILWVFLLGQLALGVSIIVRGARYHAAVQVSRAVIRPISQPDPWKKALGGPGGPRYPIGGEDYEVAL